VFVDAAPAQVTHHAAELRLAAVQLHGDEDAAYVAALRPLLPPGCAVWKAARVRDRLPDPAASGADLLLLDGYREGARGGSGRRFDWGLLAGRELARIGVAGGLAPENAAAADALGAALLDVSSGVEEAPGIKSPMLIERFLAALRGHGREE
jgi:indole-3-glycerol phosphate synthase/phosphoribosylanthranilate isomerase